MANHSIKPALRDKISAKFSEKGPVPSEPLFRPALLKTMGYVVSSVSVLLLAIVSWKSAKEDLVIALCLMGGIVTSLLGMLLRWLSYQLDD
jgi:hypothetical protein